MATRTRAIINQRGFEALGVVLAIVALIVLGGTGFALYKHQHKGKLGVALATTSSATPPMVSPSKPAQPQPSESPRFNIPEIKVAITLPDNLKGLTYVADTTSVQGTTFIRFTTTSLRSADGSQSQCGAGQGPLGVMWTSTQDPATSGASVNVHKQIGNFYLLYQRPQGVCSNNDATLQMQLAQRTALEQTVSTATTL